MRRLTMLLIVAAAAAGCRTTPPQAYCRPTYTPTYAAAAPCGCNPCGGGMTTSATMATPAMGSPVIETYGTPTIQTGPTVVSPGGPGPQSYAPTTN